MAGALVALGLALGSGAAGGSSSALVVGVAASGGSIPDGTVLRIGDEFGLLQGVMGLAGEGEDLPYEIEYATMLPGPSQLQALQAGAIDAGSLSSLALIQAGSGGLDVQAVARWRADFALSALVTAPEIDDVAGWGDLAGRRVAFQRGTTAEAVVTLALDGAGLSLDDVTAVDVPQLQLGAVLQEGHADVALMSAPFAVSYLAENPAATQVLGVENPVGQSRLIAASLDTLDDPAVSAALGDFVARLDRAFRSLTADRDEFADIVVEIWGLDRDHVEEVLVDSAGVAMGEVPGELLEPMDRLIELLSAQGDVPATLEAADLFDGRYNGLLG